MLSLKSLGYKFRATYFRIKIRIFCVNRRVYLTKFVLKLLEVPELNI